MNLPAPVVLEYSSFFDAFFASSIAVSLLTLFLLFLLKGKHTFLRFGITSVRLLALLIVVRGFLPVELQAPTFPITQTIFSHKILPALWDLLLYPLWTSGSFTVTPMILLIILWLLGFLCCLSTGGIPSSPAVRLRQSHRHRNFPWTNALPGL